MLIRQTNRAVGHLGRSAFTLAELLAVVAILAILAGVAVPIFISTIGSSRERIAKSETKKFASLLKTFAAKHQDEFPQTNGYPGQSGDLSALVQDGLLDNMKVDPWNQPYSWELQQSQSGYLDAVVYSPGPPGQNKPISSLDP